MKEEGLIKWNELSISTGHNYGRFKVLIYGVTFPCGSCRAYL